MGRVRRNIKVDKRDFWALFDGGARNTYVVKEAAELLSVFELDKTEPVALGGKIHNVAEGCRLTCFIEGLPIWTHARVLEEIGKDEDGKRIEVLIGALCMQEWGIRPLPDEERLDMSNYPKEFVEFVNL